MDKTNNLPVTQKALDERLAALESKLLQQQIAIAAVIVIALTIIIFID